MSGLISIIIPVYNVSEYIARCVDSVLSQSYRDLELILVDDGSTDGCGQICDLYQNKDARVRVIHKKNEGLGMARNMGLDVCFGEYVMFVDSDDTLFSDAVRVLYDRIVSDGSDMAVANYYDALPNGSSVAFRGYKKDAVMSSAEYLFRFDRREVFGWEAWGKLYRRELFSDIRYPSLRCGEDLFTFFDIVEKCSLISVSTAEVYYYTYRYDSIMNKRTEHSRMDELRAEVHAIEYMLSRGCFEGAGEFFCRAVNHLMYIGDTRSGTKLVADSIDAANIRKLLRRVGLKVRLKWMLLQSPFLAALYKKHKKAK